MNTVQIAIVCTTLVVLLWDLTLWLRKKQTISQVTIEWAKKYPFIPFACGFLMGHLWG